MHSNTASSVPWPILIASDPCHLSILYLIHLRIYLWKILINFDLYPKLSMKGFEFEKLRYVRCFHSIWKKWKSLYLRWQWLRHSAAFASTLQGSFYHLARSSFNSSMWLIGIEFDFKRQTNLHTEFHKVVYKEIPLCLK